MTVAAEGMSEAADALATRTTGRWRETLGSLLRQRSAAIGLVILLTFAFVAIFAPYLTPYTDQQVFIGDPGARPRAAPCIHILGCPAEYNEHWFGLDGNVRDLYTRVLYGTRISLVIGFVTVGIAIVVGALAPRKG